MGPAPVDVLVGVPALAFGLGVDGRGHGIPGVEQVAHRPGGIGLVAGAVGQDVDHQHRLVDMGGVHGRLQRGAGLIGGGVEQQPRCGQTLDPLDGVAVAGPVNKEVPQLDQQPLGPRQRRWVNGGRRAGKYRERLQRLALRADDQRKASPVPHGHRSYRGSTAATARTAAGDDFVSYARTRRPEFSEEAPWDELVSQA